MKILKKLLLKKSWIACIICINIISINMPATVHSEVTTTLSLGQTYSGFRLMSEKPLAEINSTAMVFQHIKSGARLLYLKNEDQNKVFSINFYTPPSDDKGVNHVIEHSVLYGSEKYPVKSPLMQIMKDSVSNYANAITFNDRTEYPFATNNSKDFRNLMGIYMDAVFCPNFRKDSKIFSQEGWHYDLATKDADLTYNGVVYNEMKGNYSSPEVILQDAIMKSLFPDTLYRFEAGGDPQAIPQLTRDKTLETYYKYYTPSNSYIYLYGKLDILDNLKFLDGSYLGKFHKKEVITTIEVQKPFFQRQEKDAEYSVPIGSDTKNKSYLSLNYAVNINKNMDDMLGLQLLNLMLFASDTSPISNAIIQSGLGSSVQSNLNTNLAEPVFQITVNGAEATNKDKFLQFMDLNLAGIVKNGIDKQTITSVFNLAETSIRAQKTVGNKGLGYGENAIAGWMYTGDPTTYLGFEENLANIKKSIDTGYFQKLVQKYFIDNKHSSLIVFKPKVGLQEEMDAKVKKSLADYKSKLSAKDIDELVKQTKDLKTWQDTPDSKKALSAIPTLLLSDINTNTEKTPQIEKKIDKVKILEHPLYTNKVAYMNMYFDTSTVPQDKLQYLYLLSNIIGRIDTDKHNATEVYNELLNVGGLCFTPSVIPKFKDNTVYYPKFVVSCSTLTDNLPNAINVISELINNSKMDNKAQLKNLVRSIKDSLVGSIINTPNSVSNTRIQSYLSPLGQYNETGDLQFYKFILDLDANFDFKAEEVINNLKAVSGLVFNKENLIVGVTIDPDQYNKFEQSLATLLSQIPNRKLKVYNYKFNNTTKNEGLMLPSQVQYIAKGYDINKLGYKYNGAMEVLGKILTTEYLMNEVREKGGAYGASFSISPQGTAMFSSYRDPNLKETLKIFDKSGDFLRKFKADDTQMTSYILGLINSKDTLLDPSTKGAIEDYGYISGKVEQDSTKIFNEIINTKAEDIRAYAPMMEAIAKQNIYCVVGGNERLQQNKSLFTKIIDVLTAGISYN
ncbi:MAG: insulinase family protein [Clostridiaceae bacterium]|nr:insulinase family protein [Clostridiaceae bacterium]